MSANASTLSASLRPRLLPHLADGVHENPATTTLAVSSEDAKAFTDDFGCTPMFAAYPLHMCPQLSAAPTMLSTKRMPHACPPMPAMNSTVLWRIAFAGRRAVGSTPPTYAVAPLSSE